MADPVTILAGPWDQIGLVRAMADPVYAISDGSDFLTDSTAITTEWTQSTDAGGTHALLTNAVGGVFQAVTDGDDNDEYELQRGGGAGIVAITVDSGKRVALEARVKMTSVLDVAYFIGLAEEGCAAGNFQTDDTGVVADKDYVGFHVLTATPTEVDLVHRLSGATAVEVAGNVDTVDAAFHRYGFAFDGKETIRWYIDGVFVAKGTITTANFPSGEELAFIIAAKTGEAVAKTMEIDWYKLVQLREGY